MDNGFSTSDAVLTSAMSGGFGGNRGGGSWGGNGGYGNFAGLASNAIRTEKAENATRDGDKCLSAEIGAGLDRVSDQAEEGRRSAQFTSIKDGMFQAELRGGDRLRDIEREIAQNARVAADCCCDAKVEALKCCCETQKLILERAGVTDALILAVEGRANLDKLAESRSELSSLKTQVACGCHCPS